MNHSIKKITRPSSVYATIHTVHIFKLPPESIAKVFRFYVQDLRQQYYDTDNYDVHRLIGITHVCQTFRTVALDSPELWCTISLAKHEVVEHNLQYSKDQPLSIFIPNPSLHLEQWMYLQDVLPIHCARIHELDLNISDDKLQVILPKIWKDLPLLSVIRISMAYHGFGWIDLDEIPLPSLKCVSLSSTRIRLPWVNCKNLTRLILMRTDPGALQWRDLVGIFARSPRLEFLQLHDIEFVDPVEIGPPVELPFLTDMLLCHVQTIVIFVIFHMIATISLTRVTVKPLRNIPDYERLQLREAISCLGMTKSDLGLRLDYCPGTPYASLFREPRNTSLHVVEGSESFMMATFDLSLVKHLYFDWDHINPSDDDQKDWVATLTDFPSLLELTMFGCRRRGSLLLEKFGRPAVDAETGLELAQPLVCPKLQVIEIDLHPTVDLSYMIGRHRYPSDTLETLISALLDCLKKRVKLGAKLETVKLRAPDLALEVSEQFEGLVGQLLITQVE